MNKIIGKCMCKISKICLFQLTETFVLIFWTTWDIKFVSFLEEISHIMKKSLTIMYALH